MLPESWSRDLPARMDPEDLREIISAYQKCVTETVQRFGGFVAKYMGDGVLVYFGYPQAHEHDAERAVRAALDLIVEIAALRSPVSLQIRVGIATGIVVVGDLIGSHEAQELGIVGETPNLAARLQLIAEPNTVVIAEGTRNLLGDLFELRDLGVINLKGITAPVPAWAVLRDGTIESRFEALRASGLTALVGREEELELLLRRWSKAKSGEGQVILLCGEAGLANRGSQPRSWNALQANRERNCATFAHRSTPTVRSTRSSGVLSGRLDSLMKTLPKKNSTSSARCCPRARPPCGTLPFLLRCCHSRMTGDIQFLT
jgi:class 3 adenylate cyclase